MPKDFHFVILCGKREQTMLQAQSLERPHAGRWIKKKGPCVVYHFYCKMIHTRNFQGLGFLFPLRFPFKISLSISSRSL